MIAAFLALAALAADPPAPAGVVVDRDEAPAYSVADGKAAVTLLLGPANGSSRAALDYLSMLTGAVVPAHVHADSDEILYVLSGEMEMVVGGAALTASMGQAVLIPAGVEHSAKCTANARLIQVYVGPGPEDRFKAAPPTDVRLLDDPIADAVATVDSLAPLADAFAVWARDPSSAGQFGRVYPHRGPTGDVDGYRVTEVPGNGPAHRLGLGNGDILLAVDGIPLTSSEGLAKAAEALTAATRADLKARRKNTEVTLHLAVGSGP